MKKIFITGAASLLMLMACKKNEETVTEKSLEQEKIEFQARQLEIEKQKLAIEKEKIAFERAKDSLAKVNQGPQKSVAATNTKQSSSPRVVTKTRTVYRDASPSRSSGSYANNSGGSGSAYPAAQQPTRQRRFTHTQKGAVVGTVTGAAAGAILNKQNRGAGAVIGGIVGGATGYGIGKAVDKKEGQ